MCPAGLLHSNSLKSVSDNKTIELIIFAVYCLKLRFIDKLSVSVGFRTDGRQGGFLGPHLLGPLLLLGQLLQGGGSQGPPPLLRRLDKDHSKSVVW